MDYLLILRDIQVENANAITGFTWGFPGISNFLGFVHALSRALPYDASLDGCGVVCHEHMIHAYQPGGRGDHVFALTRNPVTKEGKTASFVEEGRMHMKVSLLIPMLGDVDDEAEQDELCRTVERLALSSRLAGGTIVSIGQVQIKEPPENHEGLRRFERRQLRQLLPGFALIHRADLLGAHYEQLRAENPDAEPLDAWLDFSALKYRADEPEGEDDPTGPVEWHQVPKPAGGWLVPITVGYRGISELYQPGEVARTRDTETPFRFVESVYSIGQWISPHRVQKLDDLIWRYRADPQSGWYLCENSYHSA